jgi:hypothetical protein
MSNEPPINSILSASCNLNPVSVMKCYALRFLWGIGVTALLSCSLSCSSNKVRIQPPATWIAIGLIGQEESSEFYQIEEIVWCADVGMIHDVTKAMQNLTLAREGVTTMYPDIYAILVLDDGTPISGAAFNSGFLQPVDCRRKHGRLLFRYSKSLPMPDYWSPAPGLSNAIWKKWGEATRKRGQG